VPLSPAEHGPVSCYVRTSFHQIVSFTRTQNALFMISLRDQTFFVRTDLLTITRVRVIFSGRSRSRADHFLRADSIISHVRISARRARTYFVRADLLTIRPMGEPLRSHAYRFHASGPRGDFSGHSSFHHEQTIFLSRVSRANVFSSFSRATILSTR